MTRSVLDELRINNNICNRNENLQIDINDVDVYWVLVQFCTLDEALSEVGLPENLF